MTMKVARTEGRGREGGREGGRKGGIVYVPAESISILYLSKMATSCFRTSCALFIARACRKFSKHHGLENLAFFQPSYTARRVRWSPST